MRSKRQAVSSLQPSRSSIKYQYLAFGVGVILLAFFLRIYALDAESLWIDEAYSIDLALHSVPELILGTANDQHPPLYYLLLRIWLGIDTSVFFARLLSVLLGTLNVAQAVHLGYLFKQPTIGLLTGLLLAVSPMHVWYSQEVRMYMLLAVLTTALTTILLAKPRVWNNWVVYGVVATLSLYTHNFAIFVLLAHGVFICIVDYGEKSPKTLFPWIITLFGVALTYSFWIPTLIKQTQSHTMPWIGSPTVTQIRDTFLQLLLNSGQFNLPSVGQWALLGLIVLIFTYGFYIIATKQPSHKWAFELLFMVSLFPFLLIASLSQVYSIFQFKQFLFILPPLFALMLWSLHMFPRWGGGLLIGVILLSLSNGVIVQQSDLTKDNWRGVAQFIQTQHKSADLVYTNPAASKLALDYYLKQDLPIEGYPDTYDIISGGWTGSQITDDMVDNLLRPLASEYDRIWLIEFYPQFWDPNHYIEQWLIRNATIIDSLQFGGIRVRLFNF